MNFVLPYELNIAPTQDLSLECAMDKLFAQQLSVWEMAKSRYEALGITQFRLIDIHNSTVRLQYAPARIVSTGASVDISALKERPCFLCAQNRPEEQIGIACDNGYTILVNPFPIFPRHYTLPANAHCDQRIAGRLPDLLQFAQLLPHYVLFYNGPESGASAPDHMHFQAGNKGFLPLEYNWDKIRQNKKNRIVETPDITIYHLIDYPQSILVLEAGKREIIESQFDKIYQYLSLDSTGHPEPMINLLCTWENGLYRLYIFPRKTHRPHQYYDTGENHILVSPGAVDVGGVLILPREEDYTKITATDVEDIMTQISTNKSKIEEIIKNII